MTDSTALPGLRDAFASLDPEPLLAAPPALIEFLPVAIYACDASGRLCWFNSRAAALWGRSPEPGEKVERRGEAGRVYGLDGGLIAHGETPTAFALRTGDSVDGRTVLIERPDGGRITAMMSVAALRDSGGNIVGAINCFHDVTEQSREDRAARESERQLREILDALPVALYTTDAEGRITYYNEAAVEMSGRRPALGDDKWCVTWKLFHPDGAPLAHDECPMAVALNERRPVRGAEAVAERPDGSRVPFIPYPTPLFDSSGAMAGAVNVLVDIGHRKAAETRQTLLFGELNHRIKNNMQMLYALLATARRETDSADARRALDEAARRVAAMAAAQTALYQSDNLSRFDSAAFMASVCAAASGACRDGVRLDLSCDAGRLANDSAVPLALILNELVANAARYGVDAEGRGTIRVALAEADGRFTLSVEDDGPGFDLCEVRRKSSGLGLVAGLARQIGGCFRVERSGGARCVLEFSGPPAVSA
ncbi:MAG TPA: histidine kinase dimerization/phosphoacceptor domain -containing protein [Allosphingosinicella sp.]|jgi:PAS domain S-box-containing protein|nr:histidine kinase dimerization/phosphoacceptor domain -containing protein [Allosphingosinicella sp.]